MMTIKISKWEKESLPVPDSIIMVQIYEHKLEIETSKVVYELHASLNQYEKILLEKGFVKISRSVLINPRYVGKIEGDRVYMINGSCHWMSRRKRLQVIRLMSEYD